MSDQEKERMFKLYTGTLGESYFKEALQQELERWKYNEARKLANENTKKYKRRNLGI